MMLLYAVYIPKKETSFNRHNVYAFASIESFIKGMKQFTNKDGKLVVKERDSLFNEGYSLATLMQWNKEEKCCKAAQLCVHLSGSTMCDDWRGEHHEIHLVEKAVDEEIITPCNLP